MRLAATALLAALALALAPAEAATPGRVTVGDSSFKPRSIAVRKGSSVTWVWRGRARHDVYVYEGPRAGRPRACRTLLRGTCRRRFARAGRFSYICTRHGSMTGVVRVR